MKSITQLFAHSMILYSLPIIATVVIPVGTGELIDKITILEIKQEKLTDSEKLKNVEHEHQLLIEALDQSITGSIRDDLTPLARQLRAVNEKLWDIEDDIRAKEAKQEFDAEFIALARSVYFSNTERYELKNKINLNSKSEIIEEKQYAEFK